MYVVYNKHTGAEFDRYDSLREAMDKITTLDALEDIDTYTWRYEP